MTDTRRHLSLTDRAVTIIITATMTRTLESAQKQEITRAGTTHAHNIDSVVLLDNHLVWLIVCVSSYLTTVLSMPYQSGNQRHGYTNRSKAEGSLYEVSIGENSWRAATMYNRPLYVY